MNDRTLYHPERCTVIESLTDVDIGDIDMPMFMWLEWLLKAAPLA
jgi:hypothetical protein